ncbi:MAG: YdcF family protein [Ignavibacteria bacterium]
MFRNKNVLFLFIALSSLINGYLLTNVRYLNQEYLLSHFQFSVTGNIITIIFFGLIIVAAAVNIFQRSKFRIQPLRILFLMNFISTFVLLVSFFVGQKDIRIVLYLIFLLLVGVVLISSISLVFSRSKAIHWFSSLTTFIIILILFFVLQIVRVYYYVDDSQLYFDFGKRADAGVILGAAVWGGNRPSPVLRERINKGYELYSRKIIPQLVLTGGGSPNEMTEAEVAKNELKKFGVPEKDLIVEDKSNSTVEQIHFVRDRYYNRLKWNKIIIVSDKFHLLRAKEISAFNGIDADGIATETPLSSEGTINFCIKESVALLFFWLFGIG